MANHNVEILPNDALNTAKELRDAKLAQFEARRVARSLAVPTDDEEVRKALRKRAEPICFFGEDAHDRRERLRGLMAAEIVAGKKLEDEDTLNKKGQTNINGDDEASLDTYENKPQYEEFYTEGSSELQALRRSLVLSSLKRSQIRLTTERRAAERPSEYSARRQSVREAEESAITEVRNARIVASHVGDERPLCAVSYLAAHDGNRAVVATGSLGGRVRLWTCDGSDAPFYTIEAHNGRVSVVRLARMNGTVLLTCGADGLARVFCRDESADRFVERSKFNAHGGSRVSDIRMHPFRSTLIATSGFDGTIALHDNNVTLLSQPTGHNRVYRMTFHPDGSLLGTCGLDGGMRVWDLRSGRAIMTMTKAHADDVLGVEFSPDGRVLASCGSDNVFRIWDLRSVRCMKTVAAHRGLVSDMRFAGGADRGDVLFTCSFDRTVKCWGTKRNWGLLAAHTGFEDKVTAIDCAVDASYVVTASYDKTWKLLGTDD